MLTIGTVTEKCAANTAKKISSAAVEKLSTIKFALPTASLIAGLSQDCFTSQSNYDSNPFGCDSASTSWLC